MYSLQFSSESWKQYRALDKQSVRAVNNAMTSLARNPFQNAVKLRGKGENYYRYRVGDYRIVYGLDTKEQVCRIHGIHRRDKAY